MITKLWKVLKEEISNRLGSFFKTRIYVGKSLSQVPENSIILLSYRPNTLYCGIIGLIALKKPKNPPHKRIGQQIKIPFLDFFKTERINQAPHLPQRQ